jgi:hypothetical protein
MFVIKEVLFHWTLRFLLPRPSFLFALGPFDFWLFTNLKYLLEAERRTEMDATNY